MHIIQSNILKTVGHFEDSLNIHDTHMTSLKLLVFNLYPAEVFKSTWVPSNFETTHHQYQGFDVGWPLV